MTDCELYFCKISSTESRKWINMVSTAQDPRDGIIHPTRLSHVPYTLGQQHPAGCLDPVWCAQFEFHIFSEGSRWKWRAGGRRGPGHLIHATELCDFRMGIPMASCSMACNHSSSHVRGGWVLMVVWFCAKKTLENSYGFTVMNNLFNQHVQE